MEDYSELIVPICYGTVAHYLGKKVPLTINAQYLMSIHLKNAFN